MDDKVVKSLQTTTQNSNIIHDNNIGHEDEHNVNVEPSETDILYKYQQRHDRRIKNGQNNTHKPTKRGYGESAGGHNSTISTHPTCLKESFYILFTWFGYFMQLTFVLLPIDWFAGKMDVNDFYSTYNIDIAPAHWNFVLIGVQLLWQGILLTYLSLIIAEHTIKIFPKGFYYGLGTADLCLAIWDICTEHKSYLGRALSWLAIAICLGYANYIILKHIYYIYDVTQYEVRFRLDSLPNININGNGHVTTQKDTNSNNNSTPPKSNDLPPLTISTGNNNNTDKSRTSRNINAILRIQSSGSLNNSPISMSMAPSAAQKLVYDAAMAANETDSDWLHTKITDITRLKYSGLIGIVFNGTSYFLSVVACDFWIQFGVWLKFQCHVSDDIASIVALTMIFITIIIYYFLDFYYYPKYLVDNFATHIVFCITFAAMIWKHLFEDGGSKGHGRNHSFSVIFQMIIFCIVVIVSVVKIIVTIGTHRQYKRTEIKETNDQYKRVI